MHSWFLLLDIEEFDKSFVDKKYLALIVWCMLPQLIVVPLSVHLSLSQKWKDNELLQSDNLLKVLTILILLAILIMLIMSCWPWWNGAKWPDRKARLPFVTQDRLQKFRLFLKYVGGSHWEHNKKLVKISFVSTNLLFWIPKPLKENLNKKDIMQLW